MNILLAAPDIKRPAIRSSSSSFAPYLGVNYIASSLKKNGYEAIVLDPLINLYTSGDFITNTHKFIKQYDIDVLGISILSQTRKMCLDIARSVKAQFPNIKIVAGGPHVTSLPKIIPENYSNLFDYTLLGESENIFPLLVNYIENGNPSKGSIPYVNISTENIDDLDALPFPDYQQYANASSKNEVKTVNMITSRGCPFNCDFCCSKDLSGKVRYRSIDNVVDEIEHHINSYGTTHIRFQDDTFLHPKERAIRIFKEIEARKLTVELYIHSRLDTVDEETLVWFKRAGGKHVYFGIESGSERLRNEIIGKNISNKQIISSVSILKKLEISFGTYLMFGYPTETLQDIMLTCELIHKLQPDDVHTSITKIFPGSPLYNKALEEEVLTENCWLDEEIEYFTYYNGSHIEKSIGYQLLFDEQFRGVKRLRLESEINPEVGLLLENAAEAKRLKNQAIEQLKGHGFD